MYRTSTRPASVILLPPTPSSFDLGRGRDYGLPTPPIDSMATTYPPSQYYEHTGRRDHMYATNTMSTNNNYTARSVIPRPQSNVQQTNQVAGLRADLSRHQAAYSRPQSPVPAEKSVVAASSNEQTRRKGTTSDVIRPNLQIPSTISSDGGSLPDFAAQITCLFWFENIETLTKAEGYTQSSSPVQPLRQEALPSIGFRKWVVTILSTTQVTDKVIILALLFIYRLKTFNSAVKGRSGSEYRLLTVALMLGNKFLDDNTYTNKTWAEVSGIAVNEIHVMEVEFLSNMRYSLLASKEQWKEWHAKLRHFKTYCDLASRAPAHHHLAWEAANSATPLLSPPESMQTSSPPTNVTYTPITNNNCWTAAPLPANNMSALLPLPENQPRHQPRKRSLDGDAEEPMAKRVTRPHPAHSAYAAPVRPMRSELPRLQVPNMTITPNQTPMHHGYSGGPASQILLPPLGSRAMSTVYPPSNPTTPTAWTPSAPVLTPSHNRTVDYATPSRRHSPHSVQDLLSHNSSPINANFPHHSGHISPSVFLQQRSSPFKPVQHVSTLLYPPPSGSLHDYPVNANQMHYQPLGKRNDYRPGVVPDYASHTPYHQNWPVLRQPNFHA